MSCHAWKCIFLVVVLSYVFVPDVFPKFWASLWSFVEEYVPVNTSVEIVVKMSTKMKRQLPLTPLRLSTTMPFATFLESRKSITITMGTWNPPTCLLHRDVCTYHAWSRIGIKLSWDPVLLLVGSYSDINYPICNVCFPLTEWFAWTQTCGSQKARNGRPTLKHANKYLKILIHASICMILMFRKTPRNTVRFSNTQH